MRALVVDDEADIRELARIALEAVGGWEVADAGGAREAIELAAAQRPDVVLLDVMMPELDGPATLERLRADPRTADLPVVFLTAKAQPSEQERLLALGVSGVITKPFDPMTLHEEVARLVGAGS